MDREGHQQGRTAHRHHHRPVNDRNLLVATLLNLMISAVEIAGGILSGSLALLSDALHNLSDTFATFIAFLAIRVGKKEATSRKTFGYKRAEILVALVNAIILLIMSAYLIREAYFRLKNPEPVDSMIMLVVGMIGLLANLFAVILLKRDAHRSLNIRAAYIHLLGDVFSSVLVVAGGILIRLGEFEWVDPVITVGISLYIIREAFVILKESVDILMQSAPGDLDPEKVRQRIEQQPGVNNMHHLHTWMLTDSQIHLEAHIELESDLRLSEVNEIRHRIERILKKEFGIRHITLQFEFNPGHDSRLIHKVKDP
jgi:cobalt-zinc-cadmium efflux system protein